MNPKRLAVLIILSVLMAASVSADLKFTSVTSGGGENANEQMNMTVEGYASGDQANFYIRKSSNPFMKQGTYLHTPDAGKTLYLVDPKEETYSKWDLDAILQFAATMLKSVGPLVKFEIANPEVELLGERAGPTLLGLSTKEYDFRTSYDMMVRIMGIKNQQNIRQVSKIITTTALPDMSLGVWLRTEPPKTGTELDSIVENSPWGKTEGVALKFRTESTITSGKKGKTQASWSEFEVTALDRNAGGPPGGYGFPANYVETQMMPTEEQLAGQESEDGKKKGRFGGLFKDGA